MYRSQTSYGTVRVVSTIQDSGFPLSKPAAPGRDGEQSAEPQQRQYPRARRRRQRRHMHTNAKKTLRARSLVEACFWNQSCASRVGGSGGGGGDAPPCVAFNTRPANHWFGRFQAPFSPAVADTLLLSALAAVIERRTLSLLTLKSARLAQTEARKGRGYATRAHREHVVRAREGELRSPRHGRCVVCIAHLVRTTRGQQAVKVKVLSAACRSSGQLSSLRPDHVHRRFCEEVVTRVSLPEQQCRGLERRVQAAWVRASRAGYSRRKEERRTLA